MYSRSGENGPDWVIPENPGRYQGIFKCSNHLALSLAHQKAEIIRGICWSASELLFTFYNGGFWLHPLLLIQRFGVGGGIFMLTITPSESDAGGLHYWRDSKWIRNKISTLALCTSVLCACKNFKTPYKQDSIANKKIEEQCG